MRCQTPQKRRERERERERERDREEHSGRKEKNMESIIANWVLLLPDRLTS
jgi:hypothetical protein